ncbi:beta-ketoacyl reductase, partial [Thermopolyspora sp. NPDC052614]|uniref:beta-ketoacyl reductase n=1 Tax=Thermopolyspora sp. NPDC052614 TaxID=3155682 RepID=UPI0034198F79
LDTVLTPKADTAWHLHELTAHHDLARFILFSSAAGTLGASGQGEYAAANAFLDGLAAARHAAGLPAVSLAWGLWAERSGMTGHLGDADLARMARGGITAMPSTQALALFDAALAGAEPVLLPMALDPHRGTDVPRLLRPAAAAGATRSRARRAASDGPADGPEALVRRLAALDRDGRAAFLLDLVRGHAAAVLGHAGAEAVEGDRPFKEIGFDSLASVELRNRLSAATGLKLSATLVFNHPTPLALAAFLGARLPLPPGSAADPADPPDGHGASGDGLDDAEIARLIATIPVSRLRAEGLLDPVLRLADGPPEPDPAADPADGEARRAPEESIDAMDVDRLVARALGGA